MKNSLLTNRYPVCYAAAILLHLLLLLSIEPVGRLVEAADVVVTIPEPDPLVFEFVESNAENDKNPPEETRLLSDRNATSRDLSRADLEKQLAAARNTLQAPSPSSTMLLPRGKESGEGVRPAPGGGRAARLLAFWFL